ncbi:YheC/YheD family protein [Paenibacillus sp. GCM10027627]|uniref:YheC/YheD family endospore coat-associated protein n=1 Tax=unclassified Paenibacillus TaxID=185978 RepID=UPI0036305231
MKFPPLPHDGQLHADYLSRLSESIFEQFRTKESATFPQTDTEELRDEQNEQPPTRKEPPPLPLIGILTDTVAPASARPFGTRTGFIRKLIAEGSNRGRFIVFSPSDLRFSEEKVLAYVFENKHWVRKQTPLPDVVYNRLLDRKLEQSSDLLKLRLLFMDKQIPMFNWSYFNKTDIYNLFSINSKMKSYIPEYVSNPTTSQVRDMMTRHSTLYFKPNAGSMGIGIYKISLSYGRTYTLQFRTHGNNRRMSFPTLDGLMSFLRKREGSRIRAYFVQQGISLIRIKQCPVDFRFHLQKDGGEKWVIAGIGAKKAGAGSITTHQRNGGVIMLPEKAMKPTFGSSTLHILQKAEHAAIELAKEIEKQHPHIIGEIGFDIGIDESGDIWMFEANSKPGRSIFKLPDLKNKGEASIKYIVDHCVYLSSIRHGVQT